MVYHWDTRNESALQLYQMLKEIGVQNNKRHLVLLDEGLLDIDPLDDNLPQEWADRVIDETTNNPWYYYREIARVPIEDGTLVHFRFDIASYASIILKFLGFDIYVEKPRQTGKTVEALTTGGLSFNILSENSSTQLFHYDATKVKNNLLELKTYLNLLPKYLKIFRYEEREKDGITELKELPESGKSLAKFDHSLLKNTIMAGTCGNTEPVAEKAGRGAKVKEVIGDEVGFWPYADITLDAAIPAYNTASQNAKSGGKLAYFHLLSTPPDVKTRTGKYLYETIKIGALQFEPYMLDMSAAEIASMMTRKGTGWIFISFQYYELGFSEEWAMEAYSKMSKEKFRRDYLLHWMIDFSKSPFEAKDLERLQDMGRLKKYKAYRMLKDYEFKVYEYNGMTPDDTLRYFKNRSIMIGCDTATGLGGERDSSTAVGSCSETGKTIFTFKNNTVSTKEFANILMYLLYMYFRKGLLIIERNTTGVIDTIRGTKYEKNMYYTPMSKEQLDRGQVGHFQKRFVYGVYQIASIRSILYDDMLVDIVKNHKGCIDVPDIVNEICTLVYNKNNKIDHDTGCHDDCTMGKMLSLFPMLYDKLFTARFGIKKGRLVPDVMDDLDLAKEEMFARTLEEEVEEEKVQTIDDLMYDIHGYGLSNTMAKIDAREEEEELEDIRGVKSHLERAKKFNTGNIMDNWYDDDDSDIE